MFVAAAKNKQVRQVCLIMFIFRFSMKNLYSHSIYGILGLNSFDLTPGKKSPTIYDLASNISKWESVVSSIHLVGTIFQSEKRERLNENMRRKENEDISQTFAQISSVFLPVIANMFSD